MTSDAHGLITSRGEFHAALHRAFADAASIGCRELWLCDPDFSDWPLGDRSVVEQLRQWAGSQRRITLLAGTFDEVVRRHPRWIEWRRQWSHVVHCRVNSEIGTAQLPTVLLAPGPAEHPSVAGPALSTGLLLDAAESRVVSMFVGAGMVNAGPAAALRARRERVQQDRGTVREVG